MAQATKRSARVVATACGLAVACALWLVPAADALVSEVTVGATAVKIGAQPRSSTLYSPGEQPLTFDNPEGHPVMHASATYAIYWDPLYLYHGDWQHLIDNFLQAEGSESGSLAGVFSLDEQYTDKSNGRAAYKSTFRGAYTDTAPYPKSGCTDPDEAMGYPSETAYEYNYACLTDKQLQEELQKLIAREKLPTGMETLFFVLTPPHVTVCVDEGGTLTSHCSDTPSSSANGFCSYHSAITSNPVSGNADTVLYAVIPWTAGGLGDSGLEQTSGYECQDGGWDPSAKKGEVQEGSSESPEAPHQQEPNQLAGRGPDGMFDTGLADLIVNQVAVEQQDTVTDPLLNAWQDAKGYEAVDECRDSFALTAGGAVTKQENTEAGTLYNQTLDGSHYYLNDAFNLAALKQNYPGIPCLPGARLEPQFTAPNPVNAGDIVGFDAGESDITLDAGTGFSSKGAPLETFPTYTWDFGDGTKTTSPYPPGAAQTDEPSAFHSYKYGGTYEVTLTVTDVGGNTASFTRPITVAGPAAPPPPSAQGPTTSSQASGTGSAGPASSTQASTGSSSGSTASGSSDKPTGTPAPKIYERIGSRSLKKVLHDGLAIRYAVSEQVAGSVELLLDSATAARLNIHGPKAKGLPKGSPRSIVLGFAVLVTTKAGHGALHVKLSREATERLSAARHIKLTLRIRVRNADRKHPRTTTLMSAVVLKA